MRHRPRMIQEPQLRTEQLRPIFDQTELQHGIWMELVPHKLTVIIVQPGTGANPKIGDFICLKQFIYLEDMTNIKQERVSYIFGRKQILPGLQSCLALCRQGFKGRYLINSAFAYGDQQVAGIPANSNLIFDIEINAITSEPLSSGNRQDQWLFTEIVNRAQAGDLHAKRGEYIQAQKCFQSAFNSIQSTRSKQIKNFLYSLTKINYMIANKQKTSDQIQKQKKRLVQIYQTFDIIKIKTIEIALINQDFYKVIMLTKLCFMESRLDQNERILTARGLAFLEVGEFDASEKIITHLRDTYPDNNNYQKYLQKVCQKRQKYIGSENPVLAFTVSNTNGIKKIKQTQTPQFPTIKEDYLKMLQVSQPINEKYKYQMTRAKMVDDDDFYCF